MNPTETEITEALDACMKLIDAIHKAHTENQIIFSMDKNGAIIKAHDAIYDIYQDLGIL